MVKLFKYLITLIEQKIRRHKTRRAHLNLYGKFKMSDFDPSAF